MESLAVTDEALYNLLKTCFGYDSFRPLQKDIIGRVLSRRDTLAILPTGAGKSLCYQLPALVFPQLTLVVSPLISLMKDQVDQTSELGIGAVYLNSALSAQDYKTNLDKIASGDCRLVFLAPESLFSGRLDRHFAEWQVNLLVVDEAHCISEWGHDFRPEYRRLSELRQRFPQAVCLALTATATHKVRQDIVRCLSLGEDSTLVAGFDRPNLFLEVKPKAKPKEQLTAFLRSRRGQAGIVYCQSRKQVEALTDFLTGEGFLAGAYHAGLADDERHQTQDRFLAEELDLIVATVAFGMGINKSNVRFVVHFDLPKSLENYYQEIGRAGRDGLPAHCLLLYSFGDTKKLEFMLQDRPEEERRTAKKQIQAMVDFAESPVCRRIPLLKHFGEIFVPTETGCSGCDRCRDGGPQKVDRTIPAQKFLSCVIRTGELYGAAYVTDVLMAAENDKIRQNNHQTLTTYGIGSELNKSEWLDLSRQLEAAGLLDRDPQYQGLRLSERGRTFLRDRQEFLGLPSRPKAEKKAKSGPAISSSGEDRPEGGLFEVLRQLRRRLAQEAGVPPYVVFSDKTLVDMVEKRPQNLEDLGEVFGVGKAKASKYGEDFLQAIRDYRN